MVTIEDIKYLPGSELVLKGLEDRSAGIESAETLLLKIDSTNLMEAGLLEEDCADMNANLDLYNILSKTETNPHSLYKSLIARLTKFDAALQQLSKN